MKKTVALAVIALSQIAFGDADKDQRIKDVIAAVRGAKTQEEQQSVLTNIAEAVTGADFAKAERETQVKALLAYVQALTVALGKAAHEDRSDRFVVANRLLKDYADIPAARTSARIILAKQAFVKANHDAAQTFLEGVVSDTEADKSAAGAAHRLLAQCHMAKGDYAAALAHSEAGGDRLAQATALRKLDRADDADALLMNTLLSGGRIAAWDAKKRKLFDAIRVRPETQPQYRKFCADLNFLILPVEANIEIKTLLKRIADGQ